MKINCLRLKEGAMQARGVVVIIDVFRAFSVEACLYAKNVQKVMPVGSIEEALRLKEANDDVVLIGERNGVKLEGFDFGNSPSTVLKHDFTGKTVVHTTSAGTLGLSCAKDADVLLTGALVNAKATAKYILALNPKEVSLVSLGWNGERDTEEDLLCAMYLKSLLEGNEMKNIRELADELRNSEGKKFFDETQQDVFPKEDFFVCVDVDRFDFAIVVEHVDGCMVCRKEDVNA